MDYPEQVAQRHAFSVSCQANRLCFAIKIVTDPAGSRVMSCVDMDKLVKMIR